MSDILDSAHFYNLELELIVELHIFCSGVNSSRATLFFLSASTFHQQVLLNNFFQLAKFF